MVIYVVNARISRSPRTLRARAQARCKAAAALKYPSLVTVAPPCTIPHLCVKNVPETVAYYASKLCFGIVHTPDEYATVHGQVYLPADKEPETSTTQIMFKPLPTDAEWKGVKFVPSSSMIRLEHKEDVDEFFEKAKQKGTTVLEEPNSKPWRIRQAMFKDLDGQFHIRATANLCSCRSSSYHLLRVRTPQLRKAGKTVAEIW
jgi:uncharacterized glyoxalase superfamily protein PhnB